MRDMKARIVHLTAFLAATFFACAVVAQSGTGRLNPEQLKAVPDGNYLVTVESGGKQQRLNLKVQGNRATCVASTVPAHKSVTGEFQLIRNGVFGARFIGGLGTQVWIFRPDGAAAIREVPDRGEQQSAVPVQGQSLDLPKAK